MYQEIINFLSIYGGWIITNLMLSVALIYADYNIIQYRKLLNKAVDELSDYRLMLDDSLELIKKYQENDR